MPSKSKTFGKRPTSKRTPNPFQQKWEQSNQTLLRKRSQTAAFAKQSGQNTFHDGRIGESDPHLDDENRYLYRLQRERAKRVRKRARFSLADDETLGDELGAALSAFGSNPHDKVGLLPDENDEDDVGEESGEEGELMKLKQPAEESDDDKGERTRREIMEEVMQKSKLFKAQRQHEKHETDEQTAKLDEELPELMQMLAQSRADYEARKPKLALSLKGESQPSTIFNPDSTASKSDGPKPTFNYDNAYQQLAQEKRARPSDRLLTEEEKAERERDRLMELEEQRKSRMESMGDSDEELVEEHPSKELRKERSKDTGGDDLDDDFDLPERDERSGSEKEIHDEEGDGESDTSGRGDAEQRLEKLIETPLTFWKGVHRESFPATEGGAEKEVPFIFKRCPETSQELQVLMRGKGIAQRDLVVDRLRKCFAESLNPARNRPRLERLLECLLFRIERLTELDAEPLQSGIKEIDMLLVHVHSMGQRYGQVINAWSKRNLNEMRNKLAQKCTPLSKAWKVADVLVARAIARLYPSSDVRHPIATPLALLLSEAISMSRMECIADVALGVYVANVLLENMLGREGYSGQLGKLVHEVVRAICPESQLTKPGKLTSMFKAIRRNKDTKEAPLSLKDCFQLLGNHDMESNVDIQRKVVHAIVTVAEGLNFSGHNRNWDLMLSGLPIETLEVPKTRDRLTTLMSQSRVNRAPLALYARASRPIVKSVNPRYSAESGVYRKRPKTSYHARIQGDVSASAKRVSRALRKEERGFARDVRRDAQYAAAQRARDRQIDDEDRDRRHREVMSFLEHQQATWKAAEKRQKKLSGKKW